LYYNKSEAMIWQITKFGYWNTIYS